MCAAWKKRNERNEIVCFYFTQSDILLFGIARFSWWNKNKLRIFQKWKKKKKKKRTASLKQNLLVLGSYKKRVYFRLQVLNTLQNNMSRGYNMRMWIVAHALISSWDRLHAERFVLWFSLLIFYRNFSVHNVKFILWILPKAFHF